MSSPQDRVQHYVGQLDREVRYRDGAALPAAVMVLTAATSSCPNTPPWTTSRGPRRFPRPMPSSAWSFSTSS